MIAISILAIIAAVGMTSYSQSQKLARDAKRKQDIRSIAVALELYHQKNKVYPPSNSTAPGCNFNGMWCKSSNATEPWIPGLTSTYISKLPRDPVNDNVSDPGLSTTGGYIYTGMPCVAGGTPYFFIGAALENQNDPDGNLKQHYKYCGVDTTTWGWKNLYILSSE